MDMGGGHGMVGQYEGGNTATRLGSGYVSSSDYKGTWGKRCTFGYEVGKQIQGCAVSMMLGIEYEGGQ